MDSLAQEDVFVLVRFEKGDLNFTHNKISEMLKSLYSQGAVSLSYLMDVTSPELGEVEVYIGGNDYNYPEGFNSNGKELFQCRANLVHPDREMRKRFFDTLKKQKTYLSLIDFSAECGIDFEVIATQPAFVQIIPTRTN